MNQELRRLLLGLGFALLVGGWGVTRFVHERQEVLAADPHAKHDLWIGQYNFWRQNNPYAKPSARGSRDLFLFGIVCMGAGAGLLGFAFSPVTASTAPVVSSSSTEN